MMGSCHTKGALGIVLGPSWPILWLSCGHLGTILGPSWGPFGTILANSGANSGTSSGTNSGANLGDHLGAILGQLGAILGHLGAYWSISGHLACPLWTPEQKSKKLFALQVNWAILRPIWPPKGYPNAKPMGCQVAGCQMIADLPAAANGAERLISDRGTLKHKISGPSNTWFAKNQEKFYIWPFACVST